MNNEQIDKAADEVSDGLKDLIGGFNKKSKRYCPNCGRAIPEDALICPYCMKKF